jgi:hypothetical protein
MKSTRERAVLVLLVFACMVSGCYTVLKRSEDSRSRSETYPPYPFVLEITNYFYPGGASLSYYLTLERVVVTGTNPHPSAGTVELYSRNLDLEERDRWSDFISIFPVTELDAEYANRNVYDGMSQVFRFKLGSEERRISVINTQVEPLSRLCDEVNTLIPPEMAVGTMHPTVAERLRELQTSQ